MLHLQFSGTADPLVKLAARFDVVDLVSAPADLHTLFRRYYEGDDTDGTPRR